MRIQDYGIFGQHYTVVFKNPIKPGPTLKNSNRTNRKLEIITAMISHALPQPSFNQPETDAERKYLPRLDMFPKKAVKRINNCAYHVSDKNNAKAKKRFNMALWSKAIENCSFMLATNPNTWPVELVMDKLAHHHCFFFASLSTQLGYYDKEILQKLLFAILSTEYKVEGQTIFNLLFWEQNDSVAEPILLQQCNIAAEKINLITAGTE